MTEVNELRLTEHRQWSKEAASDSMFTIGLFVDRLAHSLRSPLSVVQSIVGDLQVGYEVGASDLDDAQSSIAKVLKVLDLIVGLALVRRSESGMYSLSEVLDSVGEANSIEIETVAKGEDRELVMDLALAQHAVRSIDAFVKSCLIGNSGERIAERTLRALRVGDRLSWSLIIKGGKDFGRFGNCRTLSDVAVLVNSPVVLGLLVAEWAMVLNGFSSGVELVSSEELRFDLIFKG